MKTLTLTAAALAALVQTALAAKCGSQSCGKDTPCCVKGYCNSNAMYCMPFNCEAGNSYSSDSCWQTAHCVKNTVNFGSSNAFAQIADYKGDPSSTAFVSQFEPSNAKQNNGQLELTLVKQSDGKGFGATVINTRAIQYGTVSTVMRSGSVSGGVVSSFIIRNDAIGDEIDFEFVGADKSTVQSNYYWHNQLDYTKMVKSPVLPDTTKEFHTYQIQWTPEQIEWSVNGKPFRTVKRSETWDPASKTFKYPDSEAYVSYSIWDGGSQAKGTSDWAGGLVQWNQSPFVMAIKSIEVSCFFNGNETTYTPPKSKNDKDDKDGKDNKSKDKSSSTKTKGKATGSATSSDAKETESAESTTASTQDSSVHEQTGTALHSQTAYSATKPNGAGALAASLGAIAGAFLAAAAF
ncbi:putative glycosidase CRH2 [Dipsacomyces acuminosporus]|nr:putative glycosidase CRH2 [Dipsacomyces acuminosporus]